MSDIVRYVLPGGLRVPPEWPDGADPMKLQDQYNAHQFDLSDMPPLEVIETAGGALVIFNGVTRATRSYMIDPNRMVPIIITQSYPNANTDHLPTIEQLLTVDF